MAGTCSVPELEAKKAEEEGAPKKKQKLLPPPPLSAPPAADIYVKPPPPPPLPAAGPSASASVSSSGAGVEVGCAVAVAGPSSAEVAVPGSGAVAKAGGGAKAEGGGYLVHCKNYKVCGRADKFKRMKSVKFLHHRQEWITDKDDSVEYIQTCSKCLAVEDDITEKEAIAKIKGLHTRVDRKRSNKYKEERAKVQELFPFLGSKGRRDFTIDFMSDLFAPLARFIVAKRHTLDLRADLLQQHEELLEMIKNCSDKAILQDLTAKAEALEEKIEETKKEKAFASHNFATQQQFIAASQYDDEWTRIVGKDSSIIALRAYYICKAGCNWTASGKCYTLTVSKVWVKRWEDEKSGVVTRKAQQRWYCPCCSARYKAGWGMLVQIVVGLGSASERDYNCMAEVPSFEIEDIKAQMHKSKHKVLTPMELYNAVPDSLPSLQAGTLTQATDIECPHSKPKDGKSLSYGVYKIQQVTELESLPRFKWDQIFNFFQ